MPSLALKLLQSAMLRIQIHCLAKVRQMQPPPPPPRTGARFPQFTLIC